MRFEVFIPAEDESGLDITLKIEAPSWMAALKGGLGRIGDPGAEVRNVVCDVQPDNSILVSDPSGSRVFRIREIEDTAVGPAPEDLSAKTAVDLSTAAVAAREAALRGARTEPDLSDAATAAQQDAKDELRRREEEAQRRYEGEEAARRRAQQEAAHRRAAEEAQRARAEAEAARKRADEEAARWRAEEEAARKQALEEAARQQAEAEAAARRAAQEAAQRRAEEEARQRAEEEVARLRAEREAQRRTQEEAAREAEARQRAEEARRRLEAERRKAAEAPRSSATLPEMKILSEKSSRHDQAAASAIREAIRARVESDDEVLAQVFEQMMDLDLEAPQIPGAAKFALRLALRHIDAESGSVLLADLGTGELSFAAVHGPKADEVKRFRIQMGQGIAGFVALEGLTLRIADAERDPRFYRQISEQLRYETHSILCAPMLHEGRSFGCIELINRRGRGQFGSGDASALSYIATKLAEYLAPRVGFDA